MLRREVGAGRVVPEVGSPARWGDTVGWLGGVAEHTITDIEAAAHGASGQRDSRVPRGQTEHREGES